MIESKIDDGWAVEKMNESGRGREVFLKEACAKTSAGNS